MKKQAFIFSALLISSCASAMERESLLTILTQEHYAVLIERLMKKLPAPNKPTVLRWNDITVGNPSFSLQPTAGSRDLLPGSVPLFQPDSQQN